MREVVLPLKRITVARYAAIEAIALAARYAGRRGASMSLSDRRHVAVVARRRRRRVEQREADVLAFDLGVEDLVVERLGRGRLEVHVGVRSAGVLVFGFGRADDRQLERDAVGRRLTRRDPQPADLLADRGAGDELAYGVFGVRCQC